MSMPGPPMMGQGQMPTPEQIQNMQRQLAEDAQKAGMTVPQFIQHIRKQAMEQQMRLMQQQGQAPPGGGPGGPHAGHQHPHPHPHPQQSQGQGQMQPITPGPPKPEALAVAEFLRAQNLKPRTCLLNGDRKDMFRVKRALRALESPEYAKARKKNPLLPEIKDRADLENTFKLLPLSMLALRVSKMDPHEGHDHGPKKTKRVKGLWTVRIEQHQEAKEDMYYVWLWEPRTSQLKRQLYAALALVVIFIIVLYPLWPLKLRQGVYYLSWGFLILLGLFFLMAIFRVILFCVTYFAVPPGLWLFPNLWEDVSFLDSFKPVWAWHETAKKKKKSKKVSSASAQSTFSAATGQPAPATAMTTATDTQINTAPQQRTYMGPRVEEVEDDE